MITVIENPIGSSYQFPLFISMGLGRTNGYGS